mmetsp:Transcript_27833/g.66274  ORF Transcript_27833/g.66274 Transcript_27833/m.66274 type:complete len:231 (-) Transcript_27833:1868-2560(-)
MAWQYLAQRWRSARSAGEDAPRSAIEKRSQSVSLDDAVSCPVARKRLRRDAARAARVAGAGISSCLFSACTASSTTASSVTLTSRAYSSSAAKSTWLLSTLSTATGALACARPQRRDTTLPYASIRAAAPPSQGCSRIALSSAFTRRRGSPSGCAGVARSVVASAGMNDSTAASGGAALDPTARSGMTPRAALSSDSLCESSPADSATCAARRKVCSCQSLSVATAGIVT